MSCMRMRRGRERRLPFSPEKAAGGPKTAPWLTNTEAAIHPLLGILALQREREEVGT